MTKLEEVKQESDDTSKNNESNMEQQQPEPVSNDTGPFSCPSTADQQVNKITPAMKHFHYMQ